MSKQGQEQLPFVPATRFRPILPKPPAMSKQGQEQLLFVPLTCFRPTFPKPQVIHAGRQGNQANCVAPVNAASTASIGDVSSEGQEQLPFVPATRFRPIFPKPPVMSKQGQEQLLFVPVTCFRPIFPKLPVIHAGRQGNQANCMTLVNAASTASMGAVSSEGQEQCNSQKNLHVLLKPQIAKLCEVLHLSHALLHILFVLLEDFKAMVERFLEYVMNNHLVSREPVTLLQAFQISLCWNLASFLKHKIDHKESLVLAKKHLGFTCKKEEVDYVHSMVRCLKRMFLYRTGYLKVPNSPKASELSSKAAGRDYSNTTPYHQNEKARIEDFSGFHEGSDIQVIAESELAPEFQLAQIDLQKSIKEIQKKCDKQMKKLIEKQKEEMKQFNQKYEEEKVHLEKKKRTEATVIRLHNNDSMRTDKLKNLDIGYARKFDELKQQMDLCLENLEALHAAAKSKVLERKTRCIETVKSWARVELVKPPVSETNPFEGRNSAGVIQPVSGSEVRSTKFVHIVPEEVVAYSDSMDTARHCQGNSGGATIEDSSVNICSGAAEEQAVYKDLCTGEQVSVGEIPYGEVQVDVPVTVKKVVHAGAPENHVSVEALLCEEIPNGAALNKPNSEVPLKAAENVSFCEGQENLALLQTPSSEKKF